MENFLDEKRVGIRNKRKRNNRGKKRTPGTNDSEEEVEKVVEDEVAPQISLKDQIQAMADKLSDQGAIKTYYDEET